MQTSSIDLHDPSEQEPKCTAVPSEEHLQFFVAPLWTLDARTCLNPREVEMFRRSCELPTLPSDIALGIA
jgi:hypothetical protein